MSRNEQLNELFSRWKAALGSEGDHFTADGIVDEVEFNKQQLRILFLGKEANGGGWDFRVKWSEDPNWRHAQQVKKRAVGILDDFPPFEEVTTSKVNHLRRIACMNVKKTPGGASSLLVEIEREVRRHSGFIREQVAIIDPDVIIGGLSWWHLWPLIVGTEPDKKLAENLWVFRWGRAKVIDFHHPSSRFPHAMLYAHLSRVMSSSTFKAL
jgi:hypothetical protein